MSTILEADESGALRLPQFAGLPGAAFQIVTANIARFESRTVFRRLEAGEFLKVGEAAVLSSELDQDVADGKIVEQATNADVEREFAVVLHRCFSATPPILFAPLDRGLDDRAVERLPTQLSSVAE